MRLVAVDLFCGAGGLTYGLEQTGVDVVAGVDIDPASRFPYEENTESNFMQRDIGGLLDRELESDIPGLEMEELKDLYPENSITALVGCAPCQPFSDLNNGVANSEHENWELLEAMRQVAEDLEPDLVAIENVAGLAGDEIYTDGFRQWFETQEAYDVWDGIIDCTDYGVPQSRKRLIMLASRMGEIEFIPPTREDSDIVTVRRSLAKAELPRIEAGESASNVDSLHKAAGLRGKNPERMRHTKEGEDWHNWPDRLKLDSQDEDNTFTAYGRMWWDRPAPTLTTQFYNWGSGRFGHPGYDENPEKSVDRAISLREGALLQTFPKDYEFVREGEEPVNDTIGQLVGNAVPVRIGNAIGGSLRRHLDQIGVEIEEPNPVHDSPSDKLTPTYKSLVFPPNPEERTSSSMITEKTLSVTSAR